MDIQFIKNSLEETKSAYKSSKNNLLWLEQYHSENQNYRDYEGREILELLQNADDAQSSDVDIILNRESHTLAIKNYGPKTLVFTKEGMRSIMASNLSPKKNDLTNKGKLIGAKGLGFKSILNWTSEICIKSDNIIARFGDEMVTNFWKELRDTIGDPETYEVEATRDGHKVPLPILRLPEISEWRDSQPGTTVIELTFSSDDIGYKIQKALADFTPESLLFLHNLRNIKIDIDGESRTYSMISTKINNHIEQCQINDDIWLVSRKDGKIEDRNFEVAAAFNVDDIKRADSYNLYTFFPTDEEFPYPCIMHATLELNASRKAILTGERINSTMMTLLADRIIDLADELKNHTHSWNSYKLISGNFVGRNHNRYALELKQQLEQKSADKKFIPVLSGECYSKISDSYYYDNALFDFVDVNGGAKFFPAMMLKGVPDYLHPGRDNDAADHIESFAHELDYDKLAKFIKIVYDFYSRSLVNQNLNLRFFRDDKNDVINGIAYLNAGRKIVNIPDFLNIKYVNDDIQKYLIKEFKESGVELEQIRSIARRLNDAITSVSQSDVSGIKQMLMLSRADENRYEPKQIEQIIACLYNLYRSNPDEFKKIKTECFLPTEGGRLRAAGELIFGDEKFPNGFRRLHLIGELYSSNDYVRFPDFLTSEDENSNRTIQDFYSELGVNKYYRIKKVRYGDDEEYLKLNKISEKVITYAKASKVNDANTCSIPIGIENWSVLNLTDLVRLIFASGIAREIMDDIGLTWCYNRGWFGPEPLKINYISYLLQNETAAKRLQNYVITTKEWLTDPDKSFSYDDKDERVRLVLTRLGAKNSYSDFTPDDLYCMINAKAVDYERTRNAIGIPEFYHRVKMAFVSMGENVSLPETPLQMLCTHKGEMKLEDSRNIFYSNNWTSKKLESELPILALQLRDGEDQVSKFFGCRRVKDLKIKIIMRLDNTSLCLDLNKHIEKLKPYILATVSKDSGDGVSYDKDKKNSIERFTVSVVKSATYHFEYDEKSTDIENFNEGDLLMDGKTPVTCCQSNSLNDALLNPQFCNAIAEAICVVLNLSSKENTDRFYRIIKASERELNFLAANIDPKLWQSCQEAFGTSDAEIEFWQHVFDYNAKKSDFDSEQIKKDKSSYIVSCLKIPVDRANRSNFNTFHLQQLQMARDPFVAKYKIWLHEHLSSNTNMQKQYLAKISDFQSDAWIQDAFNNWEHKYAISPCYEQLIVDQMKEIFNFDPENVNLETNIVPTKLDTYNYDGIELNIEDESLLYFEGNEEYFTKLRDKYIENPADETIKPDDLSDNNNEKRPIAISIIDTYKPAEHMNSKGKSNNKRGRGQTRRQLDNNDLKEVGNRAEDIVMKAFSSPESDYEIGIIYSKHLNPETGNDAQGYDMTYRHKSNPDSTYRYLEIKNFVGNSIIVSRHEYEVAKSESCKGLYDVALVSGNRIQIWRNAFSDETKYTKSSDDYTITFKVSTIDENS